MRRVLGFWVGMALAFSLAACTAAPGISGSASGTASVQSSASAGATRSEAASPSASPSWEVPAEGLAIVMFPEPGSPVSHVFVVDAAGELDQVTGISRESPGVDYPDWSPDHTQLVVGPPKVGAGLQLDIAIVNADGSDERVVAEGLKAWWSPDGARLLVEGWDFVVDLPEPLKVVHLARGRVRDLAEGYNGQWLSADSIGFQQDASVMITTLSGEPRAIPELQGVEPHWSPDGSAMLFVHEGQIYLADGVGAGARPLVDGSAPVWSPDGSRFAFSPGLNSDAIPLAAVADLDGNVLWSDVAGQGVTWSPDSTRLAVEVPFPEPTVYVLNAATGEALWDSPGQHPAWN
jgi:Tol biopolymer transport system component